MLLKHKHEKAIQKAVNAYLDEHIRDEAVSAGVLITVTFDFGEETQTLGYWYSLLLRRNFQIEFYAAHPKEVAS